MASQEATDERIFSLIAYQPRHIMEGMIRVNESARLSSIARRPSLSASLGHLETLPLEVLHPIFAMLDFKSLSHFSRTCLRAIAVVESLPAYRDLVQYAPQTLAALGKTRLIRYHSAAMVYAALISTNCVSCDYFGAFLYLPTCQRCCYNCLSNNQSFWVIPVSFAQKCFGISAADIRTLPVMRSIPGKYWVEHQISRQRPLWLVSVGAAKKLAIAKNKFDEELAGDEYLMPPSGVSDKVYLEYFTTKFLQKAPLAPPGPEFFVKLRAPGNCGDKFCGMASMPFPYLDKIKGSGESYWCRGCDDLERKWTLDQPIPDHLSHLVSTLRGADCVVRRMCHVARSKTGLLEHVGQCPGSKFLIEAAKTN